MSFKSHALQVRIDGTLHLTDPQPLVFSGRHGIVAKYVLGLTSEATRPWRLSPGDLHRLAIDGFDGAHRMIVFEQVQDAGLELLELISIHGFSRERTEMMFSFHPLRIVGGVGLNVRRDATDKTYTEELVLDGGVLAPDARWQWRRPHLALGGIVVGAATRSA